MHFPALLLLPFWCGGLCAAHGIRRTALAVPRRARSICCIYSFNTLLYLLGGAQPGQRIKDPQRVVAPWDTIFRSWALRGRILRCWLRCLSSWLVFVRLGTFRSPFWNALGLSGEGLGGSRALLFEVFSCLRAYTAQKLRSRKNYSFS